MHAKNADQALQVIMDEGVIELRIGLLDCSGDDAMFRKELEVNACRFPQCGWMNPETPKVPHDEAQKLSSTNVESTKNVLGVRFERYTIA